MVDVPVQGASEAKTAEALAEMAAQASAFAPCLLLLNHMEALVGQRGKGGVC